LSRPPTSPADAAARPLSSLDPGPAVGASDGAEGLALIKPAVRAQSAYTLSAPAARRKLNQNESPWDVPPALKREVLAAAESAAWHRYPEFAPPELLASLAEHYGWTPEGVLVGNGSNELIQATLATTLETGDVVVAPAPTFSLYRLLTGVLVDAIAPCRWGPISPTTSMR